MVGFSEASVASMWKPALWISHSHNFLRIRIDFFREQFWQEAEHQQAHQQNRVRQFCAKRSRRRKGNSIFRQRAKQDVADGARHVNATDDQRTPQPQ